MTERSPLAALQSGPSTGAARLQARNLTIVAGEATLVEAASFSLQAGELVALLGPNGAGKTSLLRGAIGLTPPAAGWARIDGEDAAGMPPRRRARRLAYLPQNRPLAWPNP
ncbi:MAG: ABC transporter ATP-binding protein, partial [Rhodospirillales bacterium]|nr:ABC transporter ATP-binding protein [Rhodospirillales bacterium]